MKGLGEDFVLDVCLKCPCVKLGHSLKIKLYFGVYTTVVTLHVRPRDTVVIFLRSVDRLSSQATSKVSWCPE